MKCDVGDCVRPTYARGWCHLHWKRYRAHGDPLANLRTPTPERDASRFWSKAEPGPGGCWLWTAGKNAFGYGKFNTGGAYGKHWLAHRFAYENMRDAIPAGLTLDHLCGVRSCVNPYHLEPVPQAENAARRWRAA